MILATSALLVVCLLALLCGSVRWVVLGLVALVCLISPVAGFALIVVGGAVHYYLNSD